MIEMKTDVSSDNAINIILLVQQTQDSSTTSHDEHEVANLGRHSTTCLLQGFRKFLSHVFLVERKI